MLSLAVGLFVVYIMGPDLKTIYIYPTPENAGTVQYKDNADNCFVYTSKEVNCPTNESEISTIPMQK